MDNLKIIENILQTLRQATSLLQGWQTGSMVDFDEQKALADLLRQALSDVWTVNTTNIKREQENTLLMQKLDAHKEHIRNTLATLSEQLNSLDASSALPGAATGQPEETKPAEKSTPVPRIQPTADRKISIIDAFATGGENAPAHPTPVENLLNAIGLSDKFLFTRELFNNNDNAFQTAVNDLDRMKNEEEAQEYLSMLFGNTDKQSDTCKQFTSLVHRRYMNA
ncbi:MAG: hypothetical protein LBN98_02035 [Prevotellaceae bacterium]|jgi:hypothetical protein|nr:hypothetical protein [Prevotellaceae bacterium]